MANAAILKTYRIVQTNNLSDLIFDLDGFLVELTLTNIHYKYARNEQFKQEDTINSKAGSYYPESEFLKYINNKGVSINELEKKNINLNLALKNAVKNDTIIVLRLYVQKPYQLFYQLLKYEIVFDGNKESVINEKFDISVPTNIPPPSPFLAGNISNDALQFYELRKTLIAGFAEDKQYFAAKQITEASIVIDMIVHDIFTLFPSNDQLLYSFITGQLNEWKSGDIFGNLSLESLERFKVRLLNYYKSAYINSLKILDAENEEKLYWLALSLSADTLSLLPVAQKISLLTYIASNKLSYLFEKETEENLAINILLSFNQSNIGEVDDFLDRIINVKPDVSTKTTLYEALYRKMSTSLNITEGIVGLSNWVFNTSFKPTTTKGQLVQALYDLWQVSKYNPYNVDGTVKPGTIEFIKTNSSLADFESTDDESAIFKYTHVSAYDVFPFATSPNYQGPPLYTYRETNRSAAPIVMPYESNRWFGIYFDNFSFKIEEDKILAYQQGLPAYYRYGTLTAEDNEKRFPIPSYREFLYGTYNIYQPVSLLNLNVETKTMISTVNGDNIQADGSQINSLIPIFVLEFIDSAGDRSDAEIMIGYVVDVATTFTGVGTVSKLKHLRWAATGAETVGLYTIEGLRTVVGGVEFTSGVLGFFANFVECSKNDSFCNAVKTFIATLQIASLTINSVDSLASLALKKQASKIISISGGTNESQIIQNIKDRLSTLNSTASPEVLNDAANSIYRSGYLYSFPANLASLIINRIKKIISNKISDNLKFRLRIEYSDEFLRSYIDLCDNLNIEQKAIEDLVIIANRDIDTKYIPPAQLERQTKYYVNEVLKRGFPAGCNSLSQYRLLCNSLKSSFKQAVTDLGIELSADIDNFEFVVQGSAVRTWKQGDPNLSFSELPGRQADDLDIGIIINSSKNYNEFSDELINVIKSSDISNQKISTLISKINKNTGKLQYSEIFSELSVGNKKFNDIIIDSASPHTRFGKDKIRFAIIRRNGTYDNLPNLPFIY